MSEALKICYDRYLPQELELPPGPARALNGRARLAFEIRKLWPNGSALKVRFMGGTSEQHRVVKEYAPKWSQLANLNFEFGDAPDAQIRIAFEDDGAWSYIGTDALGIPRNTHTMNFGWLDEAVVLHEFGHAIGLIHEHQNPLGGIQWNKPQVYRDLGGAPNFWDRATVDRNIFQTYSVDQINGTQLDPRSIMLYRIPASWTMDGFFSEFNAVLSEVDNAHAARVYPKTAIQVVDLPVADLTPTQAEIGQAGEEDQFTFTARNPGRYIIETRGPTDVVMSLYGPNSRTQLVAQDDDSGQDRNAKLVVDLAAGTYFVQVRHYSERGVGSYSIQVSTSPM